MTVNSGGTVTSYDDYYPFGMVMEGRSGNFGQADARYKFTSKERDVESGYDYFGARYYDARVGRWMSVDPLAEKYPGLTPFNYVANNPLRSVDPDGEGIWDIMAGAVDGFGRSATPYKGTNIAGYTGDQHDFAVGRVIGDVAGMLVGVGEMLTGAGGEAGGLALDATGVGAAVGVPLNVASAGLIATGAVTTAVATSNYMGDYSHLVDPATAGAGKSFSQSQKEKIREANKQANEGELKSDKSGEKLTEPSKHQKGVTPPSNEAHVDHVKPKSKGGTNSYKNGQVISRKENIKKSNKEE